MSDFSQHINNRLPRYRIRPHARIARGSRAGSRGPSMHATASAARATPPPAGPKLPVTPRCVYSPRHPSSSPNVLPSCRFLQSEANSDLTITVDGSSDLKVHRAILASQSPFFERLLSHTWRTESVHLRPGVAGSLEDCKSVEWLMHHLYCGLRHLENWKMAIDVLHLAHMCLLPSATSLATEMLKHNINNETFPIVFNAAALTCNDHMLKACEKHLEKNTDQILASIKLLSISRVSLRRLLQSPALQPSSELLLFTFVVNWGNHRLSKAGELYLNRTASTSTSMTTDNNSVGNTPPLPPPPEPQLGLKVALRLELAEFLPQIRFLTMTPAEIVQDVLEYNVLSSQEAVSVLRKLWDVPGVRLCHPVSCQSRTPRRTQEGGPVKTHGGGEVIGKRLRDI